MGKRTETTAHRRPPQTETLTPFLERSITEVIDLFVQLFTTPFAVLSYNTQFRQQISALARDDLESADPQSVARPLSFFVLLMGAHLLMSSIFWSMVFGGTFSDASGAIFKFANVTGPANRLSDLYKQLAEKLGDVGAVIAIAFVLTLIIAAKSYFVSIASRLLNCKVHFKTALHASAYAFGTFIFFQYIFIFIRYLTGSALGEVGFHWGFAVVIYGPLIISPLLVVRVNQIIRQVDGTTELQTYVAWFVGTVAWHFAVVLCGIYILQLGGIANYWSNYLYFWSAFGSALYPPNW